MKENIFCSLFECKKAKTGDSKVHKFFFLSLFIAISCVYIFLSLLLLPSSVPQQHKNIYMWVNLNHFVVEEEGSV
jgi:hypothetical protein